MSYAALAQVEVMIRGPRPWTTERCFSYPLPLLCSGTQSDDTGAIKAELKTTELSFEPLLLEWAHNLGIT